MDGFIELMVLGLGLERVGRFNRLGIFGIKVEPLAIRHVLPTQYLERDKEQYAVDSKVGILHRDIKTPLNNRCNTRNTTNRDMMWQ